MACCTSDISLGNGLLPEGNVLCTFSLLECVRAYDVVMVCCTFSLSDVAYGTTMAKITGQIQCLTDSKISKKK